MATAKTLRVRITAEVRLGARIIPAGSVAVGAEDWAARMIAHGQAEPYDPLPDTVVARIREIREAVGRGVPARRDS